MAGVELATAYVSIVTESSRIAPEVKKSFGVVGKEADRVGKQSGTKFAGAFKGAAVGIASVFAVSKVTDFFAAAIGGASDLNESSTKISAIFGRADKAVQDFASGGAKALGQTKLEVLDAAANFGTFGKAAGLQGPKLAKFSTGFASLSTDLASFFNADPSQAVEAIGAALRGEAEPIRQFGVLLDDATLRNEALRLGLIKTTKQALTPQQKVLAAQAAIYKQTKDAQGDFQRTSGGLANQQRILKAQFSDIRSELGTKLLPVATKVVSKTSELVTEFQNGTGAGGEIRNVLEEVGSEARKLVDTGRDVIGFIKGLPGPVKKTAVQVGLLTLAWSRLIRPTVAAVGTVSRSTSALATATRSSVTQIRSDAGIVASTWATAGARTEREMARSAAASQRLRAQFAGVGAAAKNAAGIGGMVALTAAAQQTNKSMGYLLGTLGGAATGFALGGPIGALIGGFGGGLLGVATSGKKAAESLTLVQTAARDSRGDIDELAGSLNEVTGAYTKFTKKIVAEDLRKSGAFENAKQLGLGLETVTRAATGAPGAVAKVTSTITPLIAAYESLTFAGSQVFQNGKFIGRIGDENVKTIIKNGDAARELSRALGLVSTNTAAARKKILETSIATGEFTKKLKGVPGSMILKIGTEGAEKARNDIIAVARSQNLTKDQIKILLKVAGLPAALADINAVKKAADAAAKDRYVKFHFSTSKFDKLDERATGGPVRAGTPYIVGEKRPEVFVPNQNGRIVPRVGQVGSTSGGSSLHGSTLTLVVDGVPMRAVIDERVNANAGLAYESERAFG